MKSRFKDRINKKANQKKPFFSSRIIGRAEFASIAIIVASFIIGIILYPRMPEYMASHWGFSGKADGYSSRAFGIFFMPILSAIMLIMLALFRNIDPLQKNIEKFRRQFDNFIIIMMFFMFYLYMLTIFWNLGMRFSMIRLLSPAFAALFYYTGVLVENSRMNWFIGIRTPWTLSSENVWKKTHELGGKLFKATSFVALLGIFFSEYAMIGFLFLSIASA
ncbi:MAG: DUF1648 domain-containing protein, partial [Candidatus Woesearchaeota archaeon]|nr:DUF1648 domain-containing protein [Candidatus Woesearchaeota archaeon]